MAARIHLWENAMMGREKVDPKLLEMAEVFHMPKSAVNKYIIMPARHPKLYQMLYGKKKKEEGKGAV